MAQDPLTTWSIPEDLTEEQVAEARRALEDLVKLLARATADVCHRLGIEFDRTIPRLRGTS